ncbi:hypothetical protein WOLCODRAFT_166568 [Wolfiporia cocos MD-104 SS10]|uniref:Uncharacterized protein n=1 Tax=Wolfiporia cocos (strain MD-104) TaxID=742152 RepID=A0A2H3JE60_WOLCO|nr:hypothetical protein WOLCODRAFT_166568 [Wolfiporia cocos MD-104 SS10]
MTQQDFRSAYPDIHHSPIALISRALEEVTLPRFFIIHRPAAAVVFVAPQNESRLFALKNGPARPIGDTSRPACRSRLIAMEMLFPKQTVRTPVRAGAVSVAGLPPAGRSHSRRSPLHCRSPLAAVVHRGRIKVLNASCAGLCAAYVHIMYARTVRTRSRPTPDLEVILTRILVLGRMLRAPSPAEPSFPNGSCGVAPANRPYSSDLQDVRPYVSFSRVLSPDCAG